jgi:cytochrome c biogenesis protein CcmG, thiol:disulfide interchange protein DsbE
MSAPPAKKISLAAFLPLALFAALVLIFVFQLFSGDPARLPSALIGQKVPQFTLAPVEGLSRDQTPVPGFSHLDLASGRLKLVNVFASWCAPCHQEHPLLMELAKDPRLALFGINYKDKPENARRFLGRLGNPYAAVGADMEGRAAIDWGVYGVPETFLIGRDGTILFKHVGPLTPEAIRTNLERAIVKGLE